jgi:hypothetical protein
MKARKSSAIFLFQVCNICAIHEAAMLTIGVKVIPARQQAAALKQSQGQDNAAVNEFSRLVWEDQSFGQFQVHITSRSHGKGKGTV